MVNRYVKTIPLMNRVERLMAMSGDTLVLALLAQAMEAMCGNVDWPDAQAA